MRIGSLAFGAALLVGGAGCTDDRRDTSSSGSFGSGITDEEGEGGDGDDGEIFDAGAGDGDEGGDGSQCMCADKSDLIYLLAFDYFGPGSIWLFNPANLQFAKVADLANCGVSDLPFSMGVARDGRAFVQLLSGDVVTVDVNTGACGDPGFAPGQLGMENFGMAFVSRSQTDPCDKLFGLSGSWTTQPYACPGQGCGTLAVADPSALQFNQVGKVDYFSGELSGTGDGRLFAFVHSTPAKLLELDRDTGAELESLPLNGVSTTDAFAFAFWGGDFYIFTEAVDTMPLYPEPPSRVIKVDWDESDGAGKTVKTVVGNAPILVAGAGVSTCAPYVPQG